MAHDEYIPFTVSDNMLEVQGEKSPFNGMLSIDFVKVSVVCGCVRACMCVRVRARVCVHILNNHSYHTIIFPLEFVSFLTLSTDK